MPRTQNRTVMHWIMTFGSLAILLVVYGGFVRLARAGLSIVEWNPVEGAIPPITEQDWQAEFSKYQVTPEYLQINKGMTLAGYKEIFLIEWFHRLLARGAGLVFALPFAFFLVSRRIPWRECGIYVVMGLLFLSQALMGWIMVSSGLSQRPSVSHYLLAAHLLLALSLIGLSTWTTLGHLHGFEVEGRGAPWSQASKWTLVSLVTLLAQIAYGAFTAGLKAGHVSDTWPLMLGRLVPQNLLGQIQPPLLNIVGAPVTVAFIHRWLAIAVVLTALLALRVLDNATLPQETRRALRWAVLLGLIQIGLGIAVVLSGVSIILALLHQLNAICLFILVVYLLHRFRSGDHAALASTG